MSGAVRLTAAGGWPATGGRLAAICWQTPQRSGIVRG